MAYIGYVLYGDGEGNPIAASTTYNEAMSKTLERIAMLHAGDRYGLLETSISVQERELSDDEVATFEQIVVDTFRKPRK